MYGHTKITDSNGNVKSAVIENGEVIYQTPETYFKVVKQTDDSTYEAEYQKNGRLTGRGRITRSRYVYEGEWKNYLEHGYGVDKYFDGRIYEGQYENGNRVGKGKITWPDGEVYEGGWNPEGPHGYGIWKYTDGTVKAGELKNGEWIGERRTRVLGQKQ